MQCHPWAVVTMLFVLNDTENKNYVHAEKYMSLHSYNSTFFKQIIAH